MGHPGLSRWPGRSRSRSPHRLHSWNGDLQTRLSNPEVSTSRCGRIATGSEIIERICGGCGGCHHSCARRKRESCGRNPRGRIGCIRSLSHGERVRISQGQDALLAPPPGQPQLGIQVKALFDELAVSLKVTLLERRVASAYGDIFENAFLNVICRFAALDGFVKVEEGLVFQSVFSQLHPKGFGGVTGQGAVTLIKGHVQRNPSCVHDPVQSPLLVQIAQESDATRGPIARRNSRLCFTKPQDKSPSRMGL